MWDNREDQINWHCATLGWWGERSPCGYIYLCRFTKIHRRDTVSQFLVSLLCHGVYTWQSRIKSPVVLKTQPLKKKKVKLAHKKRFHPSWVYTRVMKQTNWLKQQTQLKPPQGSKYTSVDSFNAAITLYGCISQHAQSWLICGTRCPSRSIAQCHFSICISVVVSVSLEFTVLTFLSVYSWKLHGCSSHTAVAKVCAELPELWWRWLRHNGGRVDWWPSKLLIRESRSRS